MPSQCCCCWTIAASEPAPSFDHALHEPTVRSPGFSRSGPPEGGTPTKWRPHGPVHGPNACEKRKEALQDSDCIAGFPACVFGRLSSRLLLGHRTERFACAQQSAPDLGISRLERGRDLVKFP